MEVRPLRQGSVPAGYKQTELGVIPKEWDVKPLRGVAQIRSGIAKNANVAISDPVPVHYLRVANVQDGFLDLSEMSKIEVSRSDLQRFAVLPGDVLMNEGGDRDKLGRGSIWRGEFQPCIHQNHVFVVRCGSQVVPDYLTNWSAGSIARRYFLVAGKQTTNLASINKTALGELPVVVPNVTEQRAIAEALSDADALIESLERLLAKKRQLKQGTMQELLTGKKRLPGFSAKAGCRKTEVGVIPKDWDVTKLASACSMKSGEGITSASIDQFSEYPCYGGNGLRGFTTRFTHNGCYALIGRQGALCGNVLGVAGKLFASEHAIVVTAAARTDIRWLTYVLGQMRLNQYSESSAQPGLSVGKLLSLDVACPPNKDEQTAIAAILSDMDVEIAALDAKLAKARLLKQGMMQELLTGRIRLV